MFVTPLFDAPPCLKTGDSRFADRSPPNRRVLHSLHERISSGASRPTLCGGYARRRSPSFKMFFAAFTSRSWIIPHFGQVHSRTDKSFVPDHCAPQAEQSWLEGKNRSTATTCFPYHAALYSNCRRNSPQLASEIAFASLRF